MTKKSRITRLISFIPSSEMDEQSYVSKFVLENHLQAESQFRLTSMNELSQIVFTMGESEVRLTPIRIANFYLVHYSSVLYPKEFLIFYSFDDVMNFLKKEFFVCQEAIGSLFLKNNFLDCYSFSKYIQEYSAATITLRVFKRPIEASCMHQTFSNSTTTLHIFPVLLENSTLMYVETNSQGNLALGSKKWFTIPKTDEIRKNCKIILFPSNNEERV